MPILILNALCILCLEMLDFALVLLFYHEISWSLGNRSRIIHWNVFIANLDVA
jgi:hypothetical protein